MHVMQRGIALFQYNKEFVYFNYVFTEMGTGE